MSFAPWFHYFRDNTRHFSALEWNSPDQLTTGERSLITRSIQQFQKGENSEGKHLFHACFEMRDDQYVESIKLFIREEQTHARVLSRFMELHHIPQIKKHWVDNVFRQLRKGFGLHQTLLVLLVAEIIAKTYYKALKQATGSMLLKDICSQILLDEDMHISFQCDALNRLRKRQNRFVREMNRGLLCFLMMGTILVVWCYHRKVLGKGGYDLSRFARSTISILRECDQLIMMPLLPDLAAIRQS